MPGNLNTLPTPEIIESWPAPDYDHPHGQRTWLISFAIVLLIVSTATLPVRLYLRWRKLAGPLGLDDAWLVPGHLFAIGFTAVGCLGVARKGVGRHLFDVPPTDWPDIALLAWLSFFIFLVSTTCTKVSVLLFHRRLTQALISDARRRITIVAIWVTVTYGVVFLLMLVFNCNPVDSYWRSYDSRYQQEYHCTDTRAVNVVAGALSTVSDFYSVALPMTVLRKFQVPRGQEFALRLVFSLGLLVVGAGCARTYYLWQQGYDWDITWHAFDVYVWGMLEMHLSNICASAPVLRICFCRMVSWSRTDPEPELARTGDDAEPRLSCHALPGFCINDCAESPDRNEKLPNDLSPPRQEDTPTPVQRGAEDVVADASDSPACSLTLHALHPAPLFDAGSSPVFRDGAQATDENRISLSGTLRAPFQVPFVR